MPGLAISHGEKREYFCAHIFGILSKNTFHGILFRNNWREENANCDETMLIVCLCRFETSGHSAPINTFHKRRFPEIQIPRTPK